MPQFIEIKEIIIPADAITWIEYMTFEAITRGAAVGVPFVPSVEPEGRTYVTLRGHPEAMWIAGDVRAEFRALLNPGRTIGKTK